MPGELLLCDAQHSDIPDGHQWMDVGQRRLFSAEFYADLLSDMGVRLALHLGSADSFHCDAFRARGLRVITLKELCASGAMHGGGGGAAAALGLAPRSLAAFTALVGGAGGATALICSESAAERGRACVLAAA